jgi:hypothetical protein
MITVYQQANDMEGKFSRGFCSQSEEMSNERTLLQSYCSFSRCCYQLVSSFKTEICISDGARICQCDDSTQLP